MRFGLIDPWEQRAAFIHAEDLHNAFFLVGLKWNQVDHGCLQRFGENVVGYAVYEFGLHEPPEEQRYFALGRALIAGKAVLYQEKCDVACDLEVMPERVRWFGSVLEIEAAIAADEIVRPLMAAGGEVLWRWPEPAPFQRRGQ
jgi:hypothetical protein